jgi:Tfp pilus assembly protein PilF
MKFLQFLLILLLFPGTCGCITDNATPVDKTHVQSADITNASQEYFDQMVVNDPQNATAWCVRGIYYNDAFSQYETALESYNHGLGLDPQSGICWYAKGTTLMNMKQFNESEICFENARKNGFDFPD